MAPERADSLRGIGCIVLGGLLLTVNDSLVKWLAADYPTGQILAVRSGFTLLVVALLVRRAGGLRALRVNAPAVQGLRAGMVVAGTVLYVVALIHLPLADVVTLTFALPLFVTAMAGPLLGERVGPRRWAAVGVGFVGVLLIVRPSGEGPAWASLLPLAAAFSGACRDILTRRMAATETAEATLAVTTLAVCLTGVLWMLVAGARAMPPAHVALLALAGVLLGLAHYLLIAAFAHAEAALIIPFKYTALIWATLIGYVVWDHVPGAWTWAGAALIVGSGLFVAYRERRAARIAP